MSFQKIVKSTKLQFVIPVVALAFICACNNNGSEEKLNTKKAPENEAPASTATKKTKKGKASVSARSTTSEKMSRDKNGIYLSAEVMPQYPGGDAALSNYIADNIDYSPEAVENNKQGTVIVSFVVDEKGEITNPKVSDQNVDPILSQEAIRVVKQMPEWKPGKVNGRNVKTWMHLPITFRIEE